MDTRDLELNFQSDLATKADKFEPFRAVITDSGANRTGTGSIWKDQSNRQVWFQAWGSGNIGWALCDRIEPVIGLGVYIQFSPLIGEFEVIRDDPLARRSSTDTTSYLHTERADLVRGGKSQLWVEGEMIQPLSVYPADTGLTVNIVSGIYNYNGTRKTYNGKANLDISSSQPAGPNEHLYVGIYLDSANTLQTVDGATVATGTDATEPTWPAGAFPLAVVDLDDSQTDLTLSDDIENRRAFFTEGSGLPDIEGQTEETSPADNDWFLMEVNAGDTYRKVKKSNLAGSGAIIPGTVHARLSLESGVAVSTSDQTAKTTIYLEPYKGETIILYDGSSTWEEHTLDSAISVAVPSTVYRLFDIFVYDNSGTLTLETVNWNQTTGSITGATNAEPIVITSNSHGLSNEDIVLITGVGGNTNANGAWKIANTTTNTFELEGSKGNAAYTSGGTWYEMNGGRATALTTQDGVYVKSGATDRLYIGTGMTTDTSGQTEDSEANRFLWNYYNQVERILGRIEDTTSWLVSAPSGWEWQILNDDPDNRVQAVVGVVDRKAYLNLGVLHFVDPNGTAGVGIGHNDSGDGTTNLMFASNSTSTVLTVASAIFDDYPIEGFNFWQLFQLPNSANDTTFYGDIGDSDKFQYGVRGHVWS